MIYKSLFSITFLLFSYAGLADNYKQFSDGIHFHSDKIRNSVSTFGNSSIYTNKVIDSSLFIFGNNALKESGRDFLLFLENNHDVYNKLSFDDWIKASYDLLQLDSQLSTGVAWGNLVIKINICNKILYKTFSLLNTETLTDKQINSLLLLQITLRRHLPSKRSMYEVALRHYGKINSLKSKKFDLLQPVGKQDVFLKKYLNSSFNFHKYEKDLFSFLELEKKVAIHNYLDIYDNPLPLQAAFSTQYSTISWNVYLYTKIVQLTGKTFAELPSLTIDDIDSILRSSYSSKDKFWMSAASISYFEKTYGAKYINKNILTGSFLDRVILFIKIGNQRHDKSKKLVFTPNTMR